MIGVILIRHLHLTRAIIGLVIGITWIVQGLAALIGGISGSVREGRAWWIIFGVVSLIAGIVVAAAPAVGAAEVLEAVNAALPGGKLMLPTSWSWPQEQSVRWPPGFVVRLAVVEVVFPSRTAVDRAVRPVMYAEAGIPVYWRVELQGGRRASFQL